MMTQELVQKRFDYDPDTGTWFDFHLQKSVGRVSLNGYVYIPCKGTHYLAHRLAFMYMEGEFPPEDVDHINGIRTDNRWTNLRKCTRSENLFNRSANLNRDLPKNVYWQPKWNRYRVKMKIDGVTVHFGYYNSLEEATAVAEEAQRKYHGEFALCLQRGKMDQREIPELCDLHPARWEPKMGTEMAVPK